MIYSGTSKGEWEYLYNQAKNENPDLEDCPEDLPYFDGEECITCEAEFPYFDLYEKVCAACPEDSDYNEEKRECLDNTGEPLQPDLGKMTSTAFSHAAAINIRHRLSRSN